MSITIEEGKFYRNREGDTVGPVETHDHSGIKWVFTIGDGARLFDREGHAFAGSDLDLVEEAPNPAVEDDGFITRNTPDWAARVEAEAAAEAIPEGWVPCSPEWLSAGGNCGAAPRVWSPAHLNHFHPPVADIKATIADEAKRIVSGARRSAYGKPEANFERIARFWDAYFKSTGRDITITAADVSPLMRLMKEARLCETPDHYDSHVDLVGYALTGSEVNGVTKPA